MRNDILSTEVERAVRVLREEVPPGDIWRQQLLHRVAGTARRTTRVWSVRPWVAVAAGIACMAAGATAAMVVARRSTPAPHTSVAAAAPRVRFTLIAPTATSVSIVGDFNGWTEGALPLHRSSDGRTWEIEVPLSPGRYAYAFVVDGRIARDPSAPLAAGDDFGTPSSVVMVKGS